MKKLLSKILILHFILLFTLFGIGLNNVNAAIGTTPDVKYSSTLNSSYYESVDGLTGDNLLEGLAEISNNNHYTYTTYEQIKGGNAYSDADPNNSGYLLDYYTGWSIPNDWDASYWNREHVWCKSLSNNTFVESGAGSDIHHIRPSITSINSARNNGLFTDRNVCGSSVELSAYTYTGSEFSEYNGKDTGCYRDGNSYFEPRDEVKGDTARILMYVYMHYSTDISENTKNSYSANSSAASYKGDLNIKDIVYTLQETDEAAWDLLLSWNTLDPVDTFESDRNNYCASVTGLRNPFIDQPDFANAIWGDQEAAELPGQGSGSETTKYTVTFNTNGGSTISNKTVSEGSTVSKPTDPTKSGYSFVGWYSDSNLTNEYNFNTVINANITLYAKWEEVNISGDNNSDTIIFANLGLANAAEIGTLETTSGYASLVAELGSNSNGNSPKYYTSDSTGRFYVNNILTISSNLANIINIKINFLNASSATLSLTSSSGSYSVSSAIGTWTGSARSITFTATATSKITSIEITYESNSETPDLEEYTVTFNTNGGSNVASQTVEEGGLVTKPENPTRSNYTFNGWYSDISLTNEYLFNTPVTSSFTLYAKWTQNNVSSESLTETFVFSEFGLANGDVIASYNSSDSIVILTADKGSNNSNSPKYYTSDTTGRFYVDNTLSISSDSANITKIVITFSGSSYVKLNTPSVGTYTTSGATGTWIGSEKSIVFTANGTNRIKSIAVTYEVAGSVTPDPEVPEYTITFNSNGGSSVVSQVISENGIVSEPNNPTKSHYNFIGWYVDSNLTVKYNFDTPVTSDLTLYAKWEEHAKYTVTFNSNGGTSIQSQTVYVNETITKPEDPTKDNYIFVNWYSDSSFNNVYYFNTPVTTNITLYAKWNQIITYTVTFDTNGGNEIPSQIVNENGYATAPTAPTKEGYVFDGWTLNGETYLFNSTQVIDNITLVAVWKHKVITGYQAKVEEGNVESTTRSYYKLVTDASSLEVGDVIILVGGISSNSSYYALGTTQNKNNRSATLITIESDGTINSNLDNTIQTITLENGNSSGSFAFKVDGDDTSAGNADGYLCSASSSSNYLRTETSLTGNSSWVITIGSDDTTIVSQGSYTRNSLRFNASSKIFGCYASGQNEVSIYRLETETTTTNAPITSMDVRFVGGFGGDYRELSKIGFQVTVSNASNSSPTDLFCTTAYTGLTTNVYGNKQIVTAESVGCSYMFAFALTGIPVGAQIKVQAFVEDNNGIRSYGSIVEFIVTSTGLEKIEVLN